MILKELVRELRDLSLPKGEYVIVSSGSLAAREIREANDLDVLVTEEIWDELKNTYPVKQYHEYEYIDIGNVQILGKRSAYHVPEIASVNEVITTAEEFEGEPFINLNLLRKFKQRQGREKDLKDVNLIDSYLAKDILQH